MKNILIIILTSFTLTVSAQYDKFFENKTLRIDFYHSGNFEHEYYRPDELIEKAGWAGSKVNLIDTFNYGKFRIMVYDKASDLLIYSRGFSTIFAEWRTTKEGHGACGNYQETMMVPYPKNIIKVVYQSRDSLNVWNTIAEDEIDPKKSEITKPKKAKAETIKLQYSGDPSTKLDIAIIADGYTKNDREKMMKDFESFKNSILNCSPYDKVKDKINIWGVATVSNESGITSPNDSIVKKTIIGSSFNTINSDRYLMTLENKTLQDLLSETPYDQSVIMCNTTKYGGGGIYNFYCTVAAGNKVAPYLFQHEFGHAFAGLADEYYTSEVSVENFYPSKIEPWEPNITTLSNFAAKWKSMVADSVAIPTKVADNYMNTVGVYEGGGYMAKGVYRPYIDCTMKSVKINAFCPVCKRAIEQMIEFYSH